MIQWRTGQNSATIIHVDLDCAANQPQLLSKNDVQYMRDYEDGIYTQTTTIRRVTVMRLQIRLEQC